MLRLEPEFAGLYSISIASDCKTQILGPNRELLACYIRVADPQRRQLLSESNYSYCEKPQAYYTVLKNALVLIHPR